MDGGEGEKNAMEDERDAAGRGRAQRAGRGGPENGNGTALRHSDTRARVKWRRESEKWSARGARSVIGGASTRSA